MTGGIPQVGYSGSTFKFTATVDGVYVASFSEFTMPSFDVERQSIPEGGQSAFVHERPIRVKTGPASLKHGTTSNLELLKWYVQMLMGNLQEAMKEVSVVLMDDANEPMITWSFRNAYPVRWIGPTFKAGQGDQVSFEGIDFVYHGFSIETASWSYDAFG